MVELREEVGEQMRGNHPTARPDGADFGKPKRERLGVVRPLCA